MGFLFDCGGSSEEKIKVDAAHNDAQVDTSAVIGKDLAAKLDVNPDSSDSLDDASDDGSIDEEGEAGGGEEEAPAIDMESDGENASEAGVEIDTTLPFEIDAEIDADPNVGLDAKKDGKRDARDAAWDGFQDTPRDIEGEAMPSNLVVPVKTGTVYAFTFGDTIFEVDASTGGRIVTFSYAGRNILTTPANGDSSNYGSTFWPSPQGDWNWPPPYEVDPASYTGKVSDGVLTLTGTTSSSLGLSVTKEFMVDSRSGIVTIQYSLVNKGTKARSFAPWEISRVAAGGLTFFPMGEGTPKKGSQDLLNLKIVDDVAWFAYDTKVIPNDQKVFADGAEGWIAHATSDLLLVKAFGDTTPEQAAPSEAEIEIYTNAGHTYIEVENQGEYASIPAKGKSVWTVRWFLRQLDPSVSVTVGSAALLAMVRALVEG